MKQIPQFGTAFEINLDDLPEDHLSTQRFDELVIEAVDSSLSMLGDSSKQAIYSHLEKKSSLNKTGIPANPQAFAKALEDIFGQAALLLEVQIIQKLHGSVQQFKYFPGKAELSLAGYIQSLRDYL